MEHFNDLFKPAIGTLLTFESNEIAHHTPQQWQVFAFIATIILATITGLYTVIKMVIAIDTWIRDRKAGKHNVKDALEDEPKQHSDDK